MKTIIHINCDGKENCPHPVSEAPAESSAPSNESWEELNNLLSEVVPKWEDHTKILRLISKQISEAERRGIAEGMKIVNDKWSKALGKDSLHSLILEIQKMKYLEVGVNPEGLLHKQIHNQALDKVIDLIQSQSSVTPTKSIFFAKELKEPINFNGEDTPVASKCEHQWCWGGNGKDWCNKCLAQRPMIFDDPKDTEDWEAVESYKADLLKRVAGLRKLDNHVGPYKKGFYDALSEVMQIIRKQ